VQIQGFKKDFDINVDSFERYKKYFKEKCAKIVLIEKEAIKSRDNIKDFRNEDVYLNVKSNYLAVY
jgi:hypothetical protein